MPRRNMFGPEVPQCKGRCLTIDSVEYDANGSYRLGDVVTLPPRSGRQRTLIEEFVIGLDPLFFEWDPNGPRFSACTERAHAPGSHRGRGCGDPVAEAPTRAIVWPWRLRTESLLTMMS